MSAAQILECYPEINIILTGSKEIVDESIKYLNSFCGKQGNGKVNIFRIEDKGTLSAELLTYHRKANLVSERFSIISNSCWAYDIYGYLDILPQTPTSQIIIWPNHYLQFLENLDYYLSKPLLYKNKCVTPRQDYKNVHVVASLGDIDVHFVHDNDFETAKTRWNTGKELLCREKMFFMMEDAHFPLTRAIAERFDNLPFENKILLTRYDYEDIPSVCRYDINTNWLRSVLNINHYIRYERFDFVKWFNNGGLGSEYEIKNLGDNLPEEYLNWLYSGGMPIYNRINKLMLYDNA
jgi:uncharacterized protein (DUF1919 family)